MQRRFDIAKFLLLVAIVILVLVMIYSGLRLLDFQGQDYGNRPSGSKTIVRDGVEYFPRQDITVILFMGIDEFGPMQGSNSYQNPGAADVVVLAIFDEKTQRVDLLSLNRDTMLSMPILGVDGRPAGTYYGQLALSHTFGTGMEDSCENTKDAVSNFLYGLRIDYYIAMTMDTIQVLNDAVGGVPVYVTDDFSAVDPTIPMGEVTLTGEQALSFIRQRKGLGDQLNTSRMQRQNHYMEQFSHVFREQATANDGFLLDTYQSIEEFVVSDCSATTLNAILNRYYDYTFGRTITLEGENRISNGYMEFHVNEEKLDKTVLSLFYAKK